MISYRDRIAVDLERMERRVRLIPDLPNRAKEKRLRIYDAEQLRARLRELDARTQALGYVRGGQP